MKKTMSFFSFIFLLVLVDGECPSVWMATGMDRIMPNATTGTEASLVTLSLARNEFESFQISIRSDKNRTVQINMEGFRGVSVSWKQVSMVYVDDIYSNPQGGAGWWPDPLVPPASLTKAYAPENTTVSLWFDVYAEPQTEPGQYVGQVQVTTDHGSCVVATNVNITVYPFVLPTRLPLLTAFGFDAKGIEYVYGPGNAVEMTYAYNKHLVSNARITPSNLYSTNYLTFEQLSTLYDLGMSSYTLQTVPTDPAAVPAAIGSIESLVKNIAADPKLSQGLTLSVYGFDESNLWTNMTLVFAEYKKSLPTVATFTTAHMTCAQGKPCQDPSRIAQWNVDFMCPILDWIIPSDMAACEASGKEMWYYTSLEPGSLMFPNLRLDNPLIAPRVLVGWESFALNVTGYLYWATNYQFSDPTITRTPIANGTLFLDPSAWKVDTSGFPGLQGDGRLLYAGTGGPIDSLRLMAIRDGMEDHAYLALCAKRFGRNFTLQLSTEVLQDSTHWSANSSVLRNVRNAIAAKLSSA